MRFSLVLSLLRPVGPVVVGVSLGFTLSLLSVTWVEEPCGPSQGSLRDGSMEQQQQGGQGNAARKPNSVPVGLGTEPEQNWEPRVLPYKPPNPGKAAKKTIRTRYISTELGMRQRLFVGVLTSKNTLHTLAVAVNRTLGHRLERLVYFTGTRGRKVPHGMLVVTHGDERPIWNMYQTVKYVLDHYVADFDWVFLVQDDTYTEAHRVNRLASHLSIDTLLYMGRPEEFIGGDTQGRYCYGGFGYLLSRALLLRLQPHLESCRNDILSARPDEWLGRCIIDYTGVDCVAEHEGLHYQYFELGKNTDPEKESDPQFSAAFTVHPVLDPVQMYRLHRHFARVELEHTYQEIQQLQLEIQNTSSLSADGDLSATWPIGIAPPFQPKTRFEVLRWDYFTEEAAFACVDGAPKCELRGADAADVADVVAAAVEELNHRYQPVLHVRKQQLLNGYRRFDPTRGMEYTLDLQLEIVTQKGHSRSLAKRVHLLRPLSEVEIIPMPYVTEASRVNVILPLTAPERDYAARFLEVYAAAAFENAENAVLTFLFIYDPFEAQQVAQNDVFAAVKARIAEYERRYTQVKIPWISVKTDAPSQIKVMDIISKKHPVDTLFFVAGVSTEVTTEFLNRCRMNTINSWQVFFPIHFQGYNPTIAFHNQPSPLSGLDLVRDAGHFDRDAFNEACFYNADYMAARTRMAADAQDNEDILETLDIYDLFVKYSNLHVFRAVEPALLQHYRPHSCNPRLSEEQYHRCVQSSLEGLGSRAQLAMVLFEQEQGNST
ncbi:chondroitin sulfate synthase 2 isoform X1 [Hemicordylus capensis]|uniref:chondroitin sulfate synthase 2 isoform X1 n=1 Tax=Hemicordylus capensis TaxID=884348 RepID=UPI0023036099|nr:chondroitin sulfate synthase 2 isoform X1 [Hemicordylus capensis]